MRIAVAGEGPFAAAAYRRLRLLSGVTIACVFAGAGELHAHAEQDDLPSLLLTSLKTPAALPFLAACGADLLVLANVPFLVPAYLTDAPRHGSICFHPSLLPRHRGKDAVRWTIAAGDRETGVTIFRPDRTIDGGPILEQARCSVPEAATPGSLYYGKLLPLGVEALRRTVEAIRDGTLVETPQDESLATYEPPFPALQRSAAD